MLGCGILQKYLWVKYSMADQFNSSHQQQFFRNFENIDVQDPAEIFPGFGGALLRILREFFLMSGPAFHRKIEPPANGSALIGT